MCKIMSYSELSDFCYDNKIEIKSLCERIGITTQGLAKGMKKQSLGMLVVKALCDELNITPNRFYGYETSGQTFNTTQVGVMNSQNIGAMGVEILQQQLAVKDEQIKQLSEQIKQLLQLLNK